MRAPETSSAKGFTVVSAGVIAFLAAILVYYAANRELTDNFQRPPGVLGADCARYANVALNMSEGRGIYVDFSRPDFRGVYEARSHEKNQTYGLILRQHSHGSTLFTPPGLPAVLAVFYKAFGWRPALSRWVSTVAMSAAVGLAVALAARQAGMLAAALVALGALSDGRLQYYAGDTHSEATAAFLIMTLIWVWLKGSGPRWSLFGALVFGVLVLVRTNYVLWLPFLAVLGYLRTRERPKLRRDGLIFLAGVALVVTPVCIRNCLVSGAFVPLGTNGSTALPGGYCDESYQNWGRADSLVMLIRQKELMRSLEERPDTIMEFEVLAAANGQKLAWEWSRANSSKLPILFLMRCANHLQLYPWMGNRFVSYAQRLVVLLLLLFAIARSKPGSLSRFFVVLLWIDLLVVGLTWGLDGRLFVPLLPLVYIVTSLGLVELTKKQSQSQSRKK